MAHGNTIYLDFIHIQSDAGRHIHANDALFNKLMKKTCTKLNILPHRVKNEMLYSPAGTQNVSMK
jgi:hypothetical protein